MKRLTVVFILLLLSACAPPPEAVWEELPTAEALLQRLAETTGQVGSLDAAAKVGLTVGGKYRSTQQFLLLEKPARLRADVLTGFGQLVLQLASNGEELAVLLNTTTPGRFFRGAASDENLARFTRLPLSAEQMVRLLLYDPPLIDYAQKQVRVVDGQLQLVLTSPSRKQELLFDPQLQLVGCRYFADGELSLEALFLKLDELDRFPRRIELQVPSAQTKLAFDFNELQTNAAIDAERFRLQQPENATLEVLP